MGFTHFVEGWVSTSDLPSAAGSYCDVTGWSLVSDSRRGG
jgi:hypothetical protein